MVPACASSSPAFCMMFSAYKLNKQGDYTALTYSFPDLELVYITCVWYIFTKGSLLMKVKEESEKLA